MGRRISVNPDAQVSNFEPVNAGTYRLKLVEVKEKIKEGGEWPYLEWQMDHVDSSVKGVNGGQPGRVWEITTLKPDAQFSLRALVEAAGLTWSTEIDLDDLIGREVTAVLSLGTSNTGKPRNEVESYVKA